MTNNIEQIENLISYDDARNGNTVLICSNCKRQYTIKSRTYRKALRRNYSNNFCSKECKSLYERQNEQERFENSFVMCEDGCWNWIKAKDKDGYGLFTAHNENDKIFMCRANRCAYKLYNGTIPENMVVMHTCDNPSCVNPSHLLIGTINDNNADKIAKNRHGNSAAAPGERNLKSKLTEVQVLEIRELCKQNAMKKKDIAEMYNITATNVRYIELKKIWKHI